MNARTIFYILTCLAFTIIIGAAVYEHAAIWPTAYIAPPKSLAFFQGEHPLRADLFWKPVHPVTVLLFAIALTLNWKTARRRYLVISFSAYATILLITFSFFVPELLSLTATPFSETVDPSIQQRGNTWVALSLVRLGVLIIASLVLFFGLTKESTSAKK